MIKLVASDCKHLEDSPFLQHWRRLGSDVLSHPDLAQICPLKTEKAQALWEYAFVYVQELSRFVFVDISESPASSLFVELQQITIDHESREKVQRHLAPLQLYDDEKVVVMWEPTEAVMIPWQMFYSSWDDFCEPWHEAVAVMSLSESWLLLYHHEDRLAIGKPRQPLLDQGTRESAYNQTYNPPAKPLVHRDEVLRLLRANEKIAAMKLYHQETGVGLKRARDAVNSLLEEIENE